MRNPPRIFHRSVLLLIGVLFAARASLAASPQIASPAPTDSLNIALLDISAVAVGLVVATGPAQPAEPGLLPLLELAGSTWYTIGTIGAPALHFMRGRVGMGFADFAARTFFPPLTSAMGALLWCTSQSRFTDRCSNEGFRVGFLVGAVGASVFDVLGLSRWQRAKPLSTRGAWYGWQTLMVDAVGLGVGTFAFARTAKRENAPLLFATGWYTVGFLGAPIVHLVHGRFARAAADLGLRVGLPAAWTLIGILGHCSATGGPCSSTGAQIGFIAGNVAAAVVDATLLAFEPVERPVEAKPSETMTLLPSVQLGPGKFMVTLGGQL